MLASARALKLANSKEFDQACQILSDAISELEGLADVPTQVFELEKERSISILRAMASQMRKRHVPSEEEDLRRQLKAAVEAENFERAAKLRDLLREMKAGSSGSEPLPDKQEPPEANSRP
jgi:excinuclease UvrABC helicase subunit UvrB